MNYRISNGNRISIAINDIVLMSFIGYFSTLYLTMVPFVPIRINGVFLYATIIFGILSIFLHGGKIRFNRYTTLYILFFAASLFSGIINGLSSNGLNNAKNQILVIIISIILPYELDSEEKVIKLLKFIIVSALFTALWMAYSGQLMHFNRLSNSLSSGVNATALLYLFPYSGALYIGKLESIRWKKWIYYTIAILLFLFLAILGSRTSLFSAIGFFIAYTFSTSSNKQKFIRIIKSALITLLSVLAIYFLIWKVPLLYEMIGSRIDGLLNSIKGGEGEFSANIRLSIIDQAFKVIKQKPILGFGYNGFQKATGLSFYTHNTYVEILCCFGAVGFIFYYAIIINAFRICVNYMRNNTIFQFFFSSIFMLLISEIGTVDYSVISAQLTYILVFSIIRNEYNEIDKQHR